MKKNTSAKVGIKKRQKKWHTTNVRHVQETIQTTMVSVGMLFESNKRGQHLSTINQNIKSMTKKDIKEFTDIVMNAELVEAKHEFPFRKGKLTYHFCYKDESREFKFEAEAESEEEARKECLCRILYKAKRNVPRLSWPKKVLDETSLWHQESIARKRMREIAEPLKKKGENCSELFYFAISPKNEYLMFDTMGDAIEYSHSIGKTKTNAFCVSV